jgi:hypothetical protein
MNACDTEEIETGRESTPSILCKVMSMMLATHGAPHSTPSHVKGTLTAHYPDMQTYRPMANMLGFCAPITQKKHALPIHCLATLIGTLPGAANLLPATQTTGSSLITFWPETKAQVTPHSSMQCLQVHPWFSQPQGELSNSHPPNNSPKQIHLSPVTNCTTTPPNVPHRLLLPIRGKPHVSPSQQHLPQQPCKHSCFCKVGTASERGCTVWCAGGLVRYQPNQPNRILPADRQANRQAHNSPAQVHRAVVSMGACKVMLGLCTSEGVMRWPGQPRANAYTT